MGNSVNPNTVNKMNMFNTRVTAKGVYRRRIWLRTAGIVALICILLLLISFSLAYFVDKAGRFTVNVPEGLSSRSISISETADFAVATTFLKADPVESMDNITESWLPADVADVDGSHNGDNHIAYTFYLRNNDDEAIDYAATIDILSVYKDTDHAVRVKVYRNGEPTLYAKPQKTNGEPEPDTTPFTSNTKVMSQTYEGLEAGGIDKYTVVIWLEGEDPECVDDILGGEMKMAMQFKIVETEEVQA